MQPLVMPHFFTFGIEIEYNNVDREVMNKMLDLLKRLEKISKDWKVVEDVSVKIDEKNNISCGEIVSPIMKNEQRWLEEMKWVLDTMNILGAKVNETCAAHVHFGGQVFNNNLNLFKNFLTFWLIIEDNIYQLTSDKEHRSGNGKTYAKQLFDKLTKPMLELLREEDDWNKFFLYFFHDIDTRYAINPFALQYGNRNTLEFRLASGTLDLDKWIKNINIFASTLIYSTFLDKQTYKSLLETLEAKWDLYHNSLEETKKYAIIKQEVIL